MNAGDPLLVVDDVFDTGRSIEALIRTLEQQTRLNMPKDVRIACPYYKPRNNKTDIIPHYFIHQSDEWLVFPHELSGLTPDEIISGNTDLNNILDLLTDPE